MSETTQKIMLASDYQEGAHINIIRRLVDTNETATVGYGLDPICESAKDRIRKAVNCPGAEVEFISGGTQTNAIVIDSVLSLYQGVIAADSGHVGVHEAGAIEYTGHKVLPIKGENGKITAESIEGYCRDFYNDGNYTHMVMPGMVYLSQPTEYGTLYSKAELQAIRKVCDTYQMKLYVDGARLAYALSTPSNDVTLEDLAQLSDVFYIGGTKCGALLGEAVVLPNPSLIPHFFTIIKQHGALLAKGRVLGIQFDELFKEDLYLHIGDSAIALAEKIKKALTENGFPIYIDSPTNQVFFVISKDKLQELDQYAVYSFMDKYDDEHVIIRFATGWATKEEDVDAVCDLLKKLA